MHLATAYFSSIPKLKSLSLITIGHLFLKPTNFANVVNKGVCGNYFHETSLAALYTIHIQLHMMEFHNFSVKQILWKSQKSVKSTKFTKEC